jgi:thiol-disulfide isomerase/thioredoxin
MAIPFLNLHSDNEESIFSSSIMSGSESTFPIQDFELINLDGETTKISDHFGKPMVINFFATWCGPCEAEMPLLEEYANRFDNQIYIIGINAGEEKKLVSGYINKVNVTFDIFLDANESISRKFLVRALPTTLFIDQEGVLAAKHIGLLTPALLDGYLDEMGISQ